MRILKNELINIRMNNLSDIFFMLFSPPAVKITDIPNVH